MRSLACVFALLVACDIDTDHDYPIAPMSSNAVTGGMIGPDAGGGGGFADAGVGALDDAHQFLDAPPPDAAALLPDSAVP